MGEALRKKWPMVERDQRISEVVSREQPGAPQLDSEACALHKIDPSCGINGVGRHLNARPGGSSATEDTWPLKRRFGMVATLSFTTWESCRSTNFAQGISSVLPPCAVTACHPACPTKSKEPVKPNGAKMEEKNLQVNEERQFHRVRFGAG